MSGRNRVHHSRWGQYLYAWHRGMGLVAALLVLLLAATGLLLNHSDDLDLDQRPLRSELLLAWYGISAPEPHGFAMGDALVSQIGDKVYFGNRLLTHDLGPLLGTVKLTDFSVLAFPRHLLLINDAGEILDRLDAGIGAPDGMIAIALDRSRTPWVRTKMGVWRGNGDVTAWSAAGDPGDLAWSNPVPLPEPLLAFLKEEYHGSDIHWERVLLDLHAGRILGSWGPRLMDLGALLMMLLALSGFAIWLRQRRQARRRWKKR